jgi:tRNA nucleotidyltransferase (CCA-adding enzyme)
VDRAAPAGARDGADAWRARLAPPAGVLEVADRLERAGFETWCVGGAIRDAVLGRPSLDWDLATAARPEAVQRLFRRTVPKGVAFGTVGVFDRGGVLHEVTTFRRDVRTDGRHAEVEFGASLDDDLARRDFTINAIAFRPATGVLADPFGGLGDLDRQVVRAVGDPPERMREDRLRALRAIRFAARFGFAIEPATWAAVAASAPHLGRLSPERVREELERPCGRWRRPAWALERWRESGALAALVPALAGQPPEAFAAADCLPLPTLDADRSGSGTAWPRRGSGSTGRPSSGG